MTPTGYKHPFLPLLLGICIAKPQSFPILILELFQFISFATILVSLAMAHDNKHQSPGVFPQPSAPYPPPAMYPPPAPAAYPPPTEVYPSPSPPPPPPQAYSYPPPPTEVYPSPSPPPPQAYSYPPPQAYSYPPPPVQGYPVTASPYVAPPPASYPMKNGPGYPQPNPPPPRRIVVSAVAVASLICASEDSGFQIKIFTLSRHMTLTGLSYMP
ncbi:hypothetical protein Acr_00g0093560 [Actinidia rufa]|uniref:Uncharacterized protein n=2 Tax=Actinidia rufa TaxID=165716 RepID=A0A7J0DXX3_9ERIC|nr:hypothetical protein Acr_00g0093560 [Actinidia rufa]